MQHPGGQLGAIEAIVFDLEDTLYSKASWLLPAIEFAASRMGCDDSRALQTATGYVEQHGVADASIFNEVLLECGQSDSAINIRAFASWVNQYVPAPNSLPMFPGVLDALINLHRKYRLCLIADGPVDAQRAKVSALGLEHLMSWIVYSDLIDGMRSRKPDPRPYRQALLSMKVASSAALFVGDHPVKDFIRPNQLGFTTVRVFTGEYARQDYPSREHSAHYEIASAASLPFLIHPVDSAERKAGMALTIKSATLE